MPLSNEEVASQPFLSDQSTQSTPNWPLTPVDTSSSCPSFASDHSLTSFTGGAVNAHLGDVTKPMEYQTTNYAYSYPPQASAGTVPYPNLEITFGGPISLSWQTNDAVLSTTDASQAAPASQLESNRRPSAPTLGMPAPPLRQLPPPTRRTSVGKYKGYLWPMNSGMGMPGIRTLQDAHRSSDRSASERSPRN
jgi:hypothetical protein